MIYLTKEALHSLFKAIEFYRYVVVFTKNLKFSTNLDSSSVYILKTDLLCSYFLWYAFLDVHESQYLLIQKLHTCKC